MARNIWATLVTASLAIVARLFIAIVARLFIAIVARLFIAIIARLFMSEEPIRNAGSWCHDAI